MARSNRHRQRFNLSLAPAACVALTVSLGAGTARADIIYDTMGMITNGTANQATMYAFIGGLGVGDGTPLRDLQVADDFNLTGLNQITSVTQAYVAPNGVGPPAGGVLVEFFSNIATNRPDEIPVASLFSATYSSTTFTNTIGTFAGSPAFNLTVDLTSANILLGPGTWWVSITPVDETATGSEYRIYRQLGTSTGFAANRRAGGADHGNGYPGINYNNANWAPFSAGQGGPGDIAMRVEGFVIPAPSALALLGLAGLMTGRRRRVRA
jgi:hypothetical protein